MRRQGLSAGRVLSVFLVVGGLSTILWMLWERTGRLIPEPPLLAGLLFLLLIAFLLGIAWPVRAFVRGTSDKALEPLRAARALVFAQAGALTGAALAGWYAAQLVMVLLGLELDLAADAHVVEPVVVDQAHVVLQPAEDARERAGRAPEPLPHPRGRPLEGRFLHAAAAASSLTV